MKKTDNISKNSKDKILEAKKIIRQEKKKLRKRRIKKFKKNKLFTFLFGSRDNYSFSEMFGVTAFSILLGIFVCLTVFTLLFGGRNYFKMIKNFNKLYDVYDVLTDNYDGSVSKNQLFDAAIDGMVSSIGDEYTSYGDSKDAADFDDIVNGTYEGIGCTIMQDKEGVSIAEVYENTPASKASLQKGDIIKSVDGKDANEMGVTKLSNYIRNESNGKVTMIILRGDKELTISLERNKVEVPTVTSKVYEENGKKIGYINISLFSQVAVKQFKEKLKELDNKKIDGLVIDVRGNSGGYLSTVTDIASLLLPKGKVIYQMQIGKKKTITKDKTSECEKYPIAILVNSGSASASEILAGVIKESYKGYVVGTKTYGKGTVQQVKKLSDGSMIKYTTQKWLTPKGNWINEVGISPTDEVVMDDEYFKEPKEENDNQLKKALELVSK